MLLNLILPVAAKPQVFYYRVEAPPFRFDNVWTFLRDFGIKFSFLLVKTYIDNLRISINNTIICINNSVTAAHVSECVFLTESDQDQETII